MNNDPSRKGEVSGETKATFVEAIIGAVGADGGFEAVQSVLEMLGLVDVHQSLRSHQLYPP
jgi:dsRNA-specific ribonuclease